MAVLLALRLSIHQLPQSKRQGRHWGVSSSLIFILPAHVFEIHAGTVTDTDVGTTAEPTGRLDSAKADES